MAQAWRCEGQAISEIEAFRRCYRRTKFGKSLLQGVMAAVVHTRRYQGQVGHGRMDSPPTFKHHTIDGSEIMHCIIARSDALTCSDSITDTSSLWLQMSLGISSCQHSMQCICRSWPRLNGATAIIGCELRGIETRILEALMIAVGICRPVDRPRQVMIFRSSDVLRFLQFTENAIL